MVRITDTGQAELDAYVASSGPVVPKTSGYGALDTRPTPQKAPAPTNVPNYTTSPGGLPNNLAPLRPFNPAPVAPQYGGYEPTDYDLGLAPKITPQQFTDIDRYMGGVTDPFTPMVDRYASPAIDLAQQLNPSRWFEPDWVSPTPDWMNAGDSAQTSQYVPPGGIAPGPSGFLPNLGVAAASFGNIMDAPRKYLSAPLAGNLLEQFDNPLDVVSALGKGPLGVIQQGIADTATPGGYRSGGENWDTQIGKLPEPLQIGANIAIDPLTWLGPGAIKGGLQGSRFANVADTLLTQPASVGLGQVAGGTAGAAAADAFDLGPGGETAAILAGTILGGGLGPAGVRGLSKAPGAFDDAVMELDARINEPAYAGMGSVVDEPMTFRTGTRPNLPERTVVPDSMRDGGGGSIAREGGGLVSGVYRMNPDGTRDTLAHVSQTNTGYRVTFTDGSPELKVNTLDQAEAAVKAKYSITEPAPLANERLWFHSTRDMKYDLPDPDAAVGTQTGITQGPGIYMAADPAKSAGNYGPRTFVAEFDGKVLDLTKQTAPDMPVFEGGPSWNQIRDSLAAKFPTENARIMAAFDGTNLSRAMYDARAELANMAADVANGYVYKQALINALEGPSVGGFTSPRIEAWNRTLAGNQGRFSGVQSTDTRTLAHSVVQNHLADLGVDALFHHSPRADGDVLIVLNGQSARVVADVKNAPDAVKSGSTLKDIRRGAARKVVESAQQRRIARAGNATVEVVDKGSGRHLVTVDMGGGVKGAATVKAVDGGFRVLDGTSSYGISATTLDEALKVAEDVARGNAAAGLTYNSASIRTFRDIIDAETGAVDLGSFVDAGAVARRRILNTLADRATQEGRPTGGIFDEILPTEKIETGLMRSYEGRTGTLGLRLQRDLDNGNKSLLDSNIGRRNGRLVQVQRTPEMEELFKALHGEGEVPYRLKHIFDDLKRMIAEETDATLKNNPDFVLKDDYFYRGWRAPKETRVGTAKGAMGSTPGYQKPRVDATFSELLAEGWEPISWNPYEMAALRRYAGVQFREQSRLIEALKETGLAVKVDAATPVGYRIPRVGPAFEGKPYAYIPETSGLDDAVGAKISQSTRYAVPDKVADQIENIFGRVPDTGAILNGLSRGGAFTKRLKLVLSLFQQIDFATRQGAAGFASAIDSLIAGEPLSAVKNLITVPTDMAKLPLANLSGARQRALRNAILDGTPLFKERPGISLKSIADAGWSPTDITIISSSIKRSLDDIADAPTGGVRGAVAGVTGNGRITGAPARRLKQLNLANEKGLFEGVYPQAQMTTLKKFIVPRLMRQHPDWTDAQISAAAATEVNKMFSTLGEFQQVVKNPVSKKLLRSFVFSTNETESLLKQAASAVTGPNKLLWTEYFLGAYVFLAGVANLVHYATTGEPLPEDRYLPIDTDDPWSPFGVGYNSKFMAPDIPIEGRGGTKVSIDLMGQLDTVFRLLDPKGFIEGRQNVIPRAVASQMSGEDFFGRDLEGPKERLGQLASDLFEPIGVSQLRGAADLGPDGEGRLGNIGQAIQAGGPNLRAETNAQLKDRIAGEMFPGKTWNSLDKTQRADVLRENPEYAQELITRRDEAAELGNEYAVDQKDVADLTERLTAEQKASDDRLKSGGITYDQWVGDYYGRLDELGDIKGFIYKDNDIKPGDDKVLDGFYNALTEAKRPDGTYDREIIEDFLNGLSSKEEAHVKKETGLIKLDTPEVRKFEAARDRIEDAGWFERTDESWENVVSYYPELGKYDSYYAWRDAQRQPLIEAWTKEYGFSPEFARLEADKYLDEQQPATDYDFYAKQWREAWVEANPQAAYDAWKYGYYTPTNDYAEWLNQMYQGGYVK